MVDLWNVSLSTTALPMPITIASILVTAVFFSLDIKIPSKLIHSITIPQFIFNIYKRWLSFYVRRIRKISTKYILLTSIIFFQRSGFPSLVFNSNSPSAKRLCPLKTIYRSTPHCIQLGHRPAFCSKIMLRDRKR